MLPPRAGPRSSSLECRAAGPPTKPPPLKLWAWLHLARRRKPPRPGLPGLPGPRAGWSGLEPSVDAFGREESLHFFHRSRKNQSTARREAEALPRRAVCVCERVCLHSPAFCCGLIYALLCSTHTPQLGLALHGPPSAKARKTDCGKHAISRMPEAPP